MKYIWMVILIGLYMDITIRVIKDVIESIKIAKIFNKYDFWNYTNSSTHVYVAIHIVLLVVISFAIWLSELG